MVCTGFARQKFRPVCKNVPYTFQGATDYFRQTWKIGSVSVNMCYKRCYLCKLTVVIIHCMQVKVASWNPGQWTSSAELRKGLKFFIYLQTLFVHCFLHVKFSEFKVETVIQYFLT